MLLRDDERLDHVLGEGLKIIQSPSVFSFSLDAVLLAKFAYVPIRKGNILDLCSGNGIIPLLLSKRTNGSVTGVEIQERLYDMACRSIEHNALDDRIHMIHGDLKDLPKEILHGAFEVVTCNPPYFETPQKNEQNDNEHFAIARHELFCTLEDVIRVSAYAVKEGGKVAIVHRPGRLVDLISLMRKYKIEPKRLQFVYPKEGKEANIFLIEGIKNGNKDCKLLPPLYIYGEDGEYTSQLKDMLNEN